MDIKKFENIDNILGIENLDDCSAEKLSGGSFEVNARGRSRILTPPIVSNGTPVEVSLAGITSISINNTGSDDSGNLFSVDFLDNAGNSVALSSVMFGRGLNDEQIASAVEDGATEAVIFQAASAS